MNEINDEINNKINKLLPSKKQTNKKQRNKNKKSIKDLTSPKILKDENKLKKENEKRKEEQISKENKVALREAIKNLNKRNIIRNEVNVKQKPIAKDKNKKSIKDISPPLNINLNDNQQIFKPRALVDMKHHDMIREANELRNKYLKKAIIDEMNKDNELFQNQPKLIAKIRGRY